MTAQAVPARETRSTEPPREPPTAWRQRLTPDQAERAERAAEERAEARAAEEAAREKEAEQDWLLAERQREAEAQRDPRLA